MVRSAFGERNEVVALPCSRLELGSAHFATTASAFEAVLSIRRVLRVFVRATVGVPFVADSFVFLGPVEVTEVPLRRSRADEAWTRSSSADLVEWASRRAVRSTATANDAGLRTHYESHSEQSSMPEPTRGK